MAFYMIFALFLIGFYLMFFYHFHYIIALLGLEMCLLSVFVFISYLFGGFLSSWACFVFLLVLVCMGGFGVSLLVNLARCCGSDFWFVGSLS